MQFGGLQSPLLGQGDASQTFNDQASQQQGRVDAHRQKLARLEQSLSQLEERIQLQEDRLLKSGGRGSTSDGDFDQPKGDGVLPVTKEPAFWDVSLYPSFRTNWKQALSVAAWVTIFFIPVCSPPAHEKLFGKLWDAGKTPSDKKVCRSQLGYMYNTKYAGYPTAQPKLEHWAEDKHGSWRNDEPGKYWWCGSLNSNWDSYWPNTVQLMFFTVYRTTGSTVKLGWQGFAGTTVASLNMAVLEYMFPHGGKCNDWVEAETGSGFRGYCKEFEDPQYEGMLWFIWIDFMVLPFLILISNSNENTKKFAMSWHFTFMFVFMSKAGWEQSFAVTVTTIMGVVLAVLATLFPWPYLNYPDIIDDPEEIAAAITDATNTAIKRIVEAPKLHLYEASTLRYEVETDINKLDVTLARVKDSWDASWWETFDAFGTDMVRQRCADFMTHFVTETAGGFDDIMYMMKNVIMSDNIEVFNELEPGEKRDVAAERQQMKEPLQEMFDAARDIFEKMTKDYIPKGRVPRKPVILALPKKRKQLLEAYRRMTTAFEITHDASSARQMLRADLSVFVFTMLCIGKKVEDYVSADLESGLKEKDEGMVAQCCSFTRMLKDEFRETFNPKKMFEKEAFHYAAKNYLCIGIAALIGNFAVGNVFTEMSSVMPSTLGLLLSRSAGSSFQANLMRLLGVTLGKVLPILVMAIVSLSGNSGPVVSATHLTLVFIYMAMFAYMYYTSPEWSGVGCCIAGFGCYCLVGTTMDDVWSDAIFVSRYQEIGQITVAIGLQLIIDVVDSQIRRKFPRDQLVYTMRDFGVGRLKPKPTQGKIVQAFNAFFERDFETLAAKVAECKAAFAEEQDLLDQCQPKGQIVLGQRVVFPYQLYTNCLEVIELLLSEMDILILVANSSNDKLMGQFDWSHVCTESKRYGFLQILTRVFSRLQLLLEHTTEEAIEVPEQMRTSERAELGSTTKTEGGDAASLRVQVASRALDRSLEHLLKIEELCISTGKFAVHGFDDE